MTRKRNQNRRLIIEALTPRRPNPCDLQPWDPYYVHDPCPHGSLGWPRRHR